MSKSTPPRRTFFKHAMDEFIAAVDEGHGRRSFKLSELGEVPDDKIGRLVPALVDVSNVTAQGDQFIVKLPHGGDEVLFAKDSCEEEIWSRIDGRATIQEIADALSVTWRVPGNLAFDRVRKLFLYLVSKQLCLPLNPLM